MAKSKPKAVDVFCGCGGTTQGLRYAGFSLIAGVDSDPLAVATYRANHKRVKVCETDICRLTPRRLLRDLRMRRGELDLLAGCPPCQAFSAMRRLNGRRRIRDKASKDLIFEYLRFVEGLLPKVVLIENVPHLINDYRFGQIRKRLRELGYVGRPEVFNAADFGVPQRRRRMIFIASRVGSIPYAAPGGDDDRLTVRDVIGEMPKPGESGDELHDLHEERTDRIARLIRMIPRNGGSRSALGKRRQLKCHRDCTGFNDVYGRMAWDEVAPTITSGCVNPSKGRFLHPSQHRCITLREAALLQSFPADYFFSLDRGKFAAALMIGNAFPPRFVEPHARKIRQHLCNGLLKRSGQGSM